MDTNICQGITIEEVKATKCNINPTKEAEPDEFHLIFLHHLRKVFISLLTNI